MSGTASPRSPRNPSPHSACVYIYTARGGSPHRSEKRLGAIRRDNCPLISRRRAARAQYKLDTSVYVCVWRDERRVRAALTFAAARV